MGLTIGGGGSGSRYRVVGLFGQDVHTFIGGRMEPEAHILADGDQDREVVVTAARSMFQKLGYRIIE